ncbi:MAG: S1 RNA-binding domain-containing protein [Lachnospiraceae bacterium]|jgi:predicted RNA-binding protein (virulence factor B family)|nr:S1 RNA-binding domain-containing protein [Lachnospiraceae bacterium]
MIELGKVQELIVVRIKEFGVYLSENTESEASVLLPKKQVPEGTKTGDKLTVFIYKDSEDRLIATTGTPKLEIGQCGVLEVKDVSKIGAFLDIGLEKDLLLPFKEQNHPVKKGESCLVALYVDKSQRLAATMKVYAYMSNQSPYHQDDEVLGRIYELNENLGAFVAVDYKYYGLIPKKELFEHYREGDEVLCRVTKVRSDGKLDLSPRKKAHIQMSEDVEQVMKVIEEFEGVLPFNDKASPEVIKREFCMSKNAFKRAVGRLLKEGRIRITEKTIERL